MHKTHKLFLALAVALTAGTAGAADVPAQADAAPATKKPAFENDRDAISYALGVQTSRSLQRMEGAINLDLVIRGLKEGMSGEKLAMDEKEMRRVMDSAAVEMRRKFSATQRELGDKNKKAGEAYLAENAKKAGVVTLPSGVQYKAIKTGTGKLPKLSDTIVVNYRGTRLDGYEFDATPAGKPAQLTLAQTIAGWKEVIQMMPEGSHWQIVVPARQAYGFKGVGRDIGPEETLLFDVELVGIKALPAKDAAASAAAPIPVATPAATPTRVPAAAPAPAAPAAAPAK